MPTLKANIGGAWVPIGVAPTVILTPTGVIEMFAGSTPPQGFLLCDGAAVPRDTYADLFAVIGTTYGAGNGTTTFNLPNLKGRFPVGRDPAVSIHDVLGEVGGSRDLVVPQHAHTASFAGTAMSAHNHAIPNHVHGMQSHTHSIDHNHPSANTGTGGSHSHGMLEFQSIWMQSGVGGQTGMQGSPAAAASNWYNWANHTGHTHTFDVPNFDGTSGPPSTANTGNPTSLPDVESVSAGTPAGTVSVAQSGVAAANQNLPPYIVLNYIIKT